MAKSRNVPQHPEQDGLILVVDDEPVLRILVRKLLESTGYTVLDAASFTEARAHWLRHKADIHLLLADCVLPDGETGQAIAEEFQSEKPGLKVIFLSGYGREVLPGGSGETLGRFVQKPFDADELLNAVRLSLEEDGTC